MNYNIKNQCEELEKLGFGTYIGRDENNLYLIAIGVDKGHANDHSLTGPLGWLTCALPMMVDLQDLVVLQPYGKGNEKVGDLRKGISFCEFPLANSQEEDHLVKFIEEKFDQITVDFLNKEIDFLGAGFSYDRVTKMHVFYHKFSNEHAFGRDVNNPPVVDPSYKEEREDQQPKEPKVTTLQFVRVGNWIVSMIYLDREPLERFGLTQLLYDNPDKTGLRLGVNPDSVVMVEDIYNCPPNSIIFCISDICKKLNFDSPTQDQINAIGENLMPFLNGENQNHLRGNIVFTKLFEFK
jgi:hypothetical protein